MPILRINNIEIDPVKRTISHNGKTCRFTSIREKPTNIRFDLACRLIIGAPATFEDLFDVLYGNREDGGPLYGIKIISVMIFHLGKDLAAIGIQLKCEKCGIARRFSRGSSNKKLSLVPVDA